MKEILRYMVCLLAIALLVSSCYSDDQLIVKQQESKKVQLELFTRATSYDTPVSRAMANENAVGGAPWVLVFKGTGTSALYSEAAQAFTVPGTNQKYVILTPESSDVRLLILANPQNSFYASGSIRSYAVSSFDALLSGKSLADACGLLLTNPLAGTQTSIPFVGQSIPMSYVYDVPGGINVNTKIGTTAAPIELIRAVSKVVVKNTAGNFTLLGVTAAYNMPHQGQLHNLTATPMAITASNLLSYAGTSGDIAPAASNSTADNPIYLFESAKANDSHIVIRGNYFGVDYYYKMAFVDTNVQKIDLLRNHEYTFTIVNVYGEGHKTLEAAENAPAYNNTLLDVKLTVTDLSAYETTSFDDYYLSVSNSIYIGYGNKTTDSYDICSVYLTAKGDLTSLPITGSITSSSSLLKVTAPTGGINVTGTAPQSFTLKAQMAAGFTSGEIELQFGNLKKVIEVKRNAASLVPTVLSMPNADYDYFLLSGEVANFPLTYWLKLSPYNASPRENDAGLITVDDGRIDIHIAAASGQTGTVYLSTIIPTPPGTGGYQYARRIKLDVVQ